MSGKKGKVILLGSESIGRGDNDLGYEILLSMLKSLTEREDTPQAIIFWNTAVKLLTEKSPAIPHLKTLEGRGVQILVGQLCIRELELTSKIAIGKLATMNEILDLILHNEVLTL